jgi:hypothetical protein
MGKYYTMKECFDECEDDDRPFIEDSFNCTLKRTKAQLLDDHKIRGTETDPAFIYRMIKDGLSDQWQIKRAGLKVLTATEWLEAEYIGLTFGRGDMECAFDDGDRNGQLREWLRPEQVALRDAVNNFRKDYPEWTLNDETFSPMIIASSNLKPPKVD